MSTHCIIINFSFCGATHYSSLGLRVREWREGGKVCVSTCVCIEQERVVQFIFLWVNLYVTIIYRERCCY